MARDDDDRRQHMLPPRTSVGSGTPITDQLIYLLRNRPRIVPYLARVLRPSGEPGPSSPLNRDEASERPQHGSTRRDAPDDTPSPR
jgi:hypothetical protein